MGDKKLISQLLIIKELFDQISSVAYRWKALDLSFQNMVVSIRGGARPGRPPLSEPLLVCQERSFITPLSHLGNHGDEY